MFRKPNTNVHGQPFTSVTAQLVWEKGSPIYGYDPADWRNDACGHPISLGDYGNVYSEYGWEVDHIVPVARGGSDNLTNLQPLYWKTNRDKGDTYPWSCAMART